MLLCRTATKEQIAKITAAADKYLYNKKAGGWRLNTDFHEIKMDMGRMFGFAYGHKENGAVFSHMAVMYANALYQRGFAKEGYRVIEELYQHSMDFENSRIYPGIPEYFDARGRGLYHYLTGAASWLLLTVVSEMFGVKGKGGKLSLEPKLLREQFDEEGTASIDFLFEGRQWTLHYHNKERKDYGEYTLGQVEYRDQEIFAELV